ncbi:MAG TPA: OPT/YSL family transporter, partial [Chthoniobacterales bacterium]
TTSQDLKTGFLVGATPRLQQIAILCGALASALALGPILLLLNNSYTVYVPPTTFAPVAQEVRVDATALPPFAEGVKPAPEDFRLLSNAKDGAPSVNPDLGTGDYLVDASGKVAYKVDRNFPADLRANPAELRGTEKLRGTQAVGDQNSYRVWYRLDPEGGPAQKFLVREDGTPAYLSDPGINGTHKFRPDGSPVTKFEAPKATLMSYIIKGILNQKLPWALVLLGVMIAIVLEMSGIPSLAFAVGVYLPLASSSPIFIGGLVRWMVDRWLRRTKFKDHELTEDELVAEGDKSPGVLLASGYIAGGALAGIVIAIMAGVPALADFTSRLTQWSTANNPFFHGPNSDLLALVPFTVLIVLLYLVGRDLLLSGKRRATAK